MSSTPLNDQLIALLKEHHSEEEVDLVLSQLENYDEGMLRDAFFDSLGTGEESLSVRTILQQLFGASNPDVEVQWS